MSEQEKYNYAPSQGYDTPQSGDAAVEEFVAQGHPRRIVPENTLDWLRTALTQAEQRGAAREREKFDAAIAKYYNYNVPKRMQKLLQTLNITNE